MRWFLYLSVFSAVCCVSYCARECGRKPALIDTSGVQQLREYADSLQGVIDTMRPVRIEKVRTAVKWREKYIHDTVKIKHFDTACPELVGEVAALWEVVRYDSVMMQHMDGVIRAQDSAIELQDVRIQAQAVVIEDQAVKIKKARGLVGLAFLLGLAVSVVR